VGEGVEVVGVWGCKCQGFRAISVRGCSLTSPAAACGPRHIVWHPLHADTVGAMLCCLLIKLMLCYLLIKLMLCGLLNIMMLLIQTATLTAPR